jgi:4-hydroxybenzoate polyprenyltransferase
MNWLYLLFCLIVVVLLLFNNYEEFRSRIRMGRSNNNKKITVWSHIFIAISALCLYIFNYSELALTLLITWPIYVFFHRLTYK